MKYDIFISYSRQDFEEVNAIRQLLIQKIPGIKIWFDIDGIESGDEFRKKIITAIDESQCVLFAWSENSNNSAWTEKEVTYAKTTGKKVIPILLKGAKMKGWFLFDFGNTDCISSNDELQMGKLVRNLTSWFGKDKKDETLLNGLDKQDTDRKENEAERADKTFFVRVLKTNAKLIVGVACAIILFAFLCLGTLSFYNAPKYSPAELDSIAQKGIKYYNKYEYDVALPLLQEAAENGHADAQYYLGTMYDYEYEVEGNDSVAVEWYKKAAEQGYEPAQYILGQYYRYGIGVEMNKSEAMKWFKKSAEQGNYESQYWLGEMNYNWYEGIEINESEAVNWFKQSAENGNLFAQIRLSHMYFWGYGIEKDRAKADSLQKIAVPRIQEKAEQGDREAQYIMGDIYDDGEVEGVVHPEEAIEWYKKAASQGHVWAQLRLGDMYFQGIGVSSDYSNARYWLKKAAERGVVHAMLLLGRIYEYGDYFIKEDDSLAIHWYTKAAELGDCAAMCSLAEMYYYGKGVDENEEEAIKWYRKAAEQGDLLAKDKLEEFGFNQ